MLDGATCKPCVGWLSKDGKKMNNNVGKWWYTHGVR